MVFKYLVLSALLIGLCVLDVSTQESECVYHDENCYWVPVDIQWKPESKYRSWHESKRYCNSRGGELVSIRNSQENEFLFEFANKRYPKDENLWTGLNAIADNTGFKWSDGSPLDFVNINLDNSLPGLKRCVGFNNKFKTWTLSHCASKAIPVCKRSKEAPDISLTTITPIEVPGYCPEGWLNSGNKCYRLFGEKRIDNLNWTSAYRKCLSLGPDYDLASFHTQEEFDGLIDQLSTSVPDAFIGGIPMPSEDYLLGWTDNTEMNEAFLREDWRGLDIPYPFGCLSVIFFNVSGILRKEMRECSQRLPFICQRSPDISITQQNKTCQDGFRYFQFHCYKASEEKSTWLEARDSCSALKGNLVSIDHIYEQMFVQRLIGKAPGNGAWIGLSYNSTDGEFRWSDDWPVRFSNWTDSQPGNPTSGSECVQLKSTGWAMDKCQSKKRFVCKTTQEEKPSVVGGPFKCQDNSWIDVGLDRCYRVVIARRPEDIAYLLEFKDAKRKCAEYPLNNKLASFRSRTELELLAPYLNESRTSVWIGLTSTTGENYMWMDGQPLNFINWANGRPLTKQNDTSSPRSSKDEYSFVEMNPRTLEWTDVIWNQNLGYICMTDSYLIGTTRAPPTAVRPTTSSELGSSEVYTDTTENYTLDPWTPWTTEGGSSDVYTDTAENYTRDPWRPWTTEGGSSDVYTDTAENYTRDPWRPWTTEGGSSEVYTDTTQNYTRDPWRPWTTDSWKGCPDYSWELFQEHCYFFSYSYTSWYEAEERCQYYDGNLVAIHSPEEDYFVSRMILQYKNSWSWFDRVEGNVWIGLNAVLDSSKFQWSDGSPVKFETQELDAMLPSHKRCVATNERRDAWISHSCTEHFKGLCKIPLDYRNRNFTDDPYNNATDSLESYEICPEGWTKTGSKCYRLFGLNPVDRVNWTIAWHNCQALGSDHTLAAVHSQRDQNTLISLLSPNYPGVWIGLSWNVRRKASGRDFLTWTDSSEIDLSILTSNLGYPDDVTFFKTPKCVEMETNKTHAGIWNLRNCTKLTSYVCQHPTHVSLDPPEDKVCSEGFRKYGSSCYKLSEDWATGPDAESNCSQEFGGHLTSINSPYEDAFLRNLIDDLNLSHWWNDYGFWIGLSTTENDTLGWNDQWPVTFTNWDAKEPRHMTPQYCTFLQLNNRKWKLGWCNEPKRYICKVTKETPPKIRDLSSESCPGHVRDWLDVGLNHCYFISMPTKKEDHMFLMEWENAEAKCRNKGASLASFHSHREMELLRPRLPSPSLGTWIGLSGNGTETYTWSDHSPVDFINWADFKDAETELPLCVHLDTSSMLWKRRDCSKNYGFICKIPKVARR